MPLFIEGRVPPRWAERHGSASSSRTLAPHTDCIKIAFVNNMPDAALEDTEMQFFELLDAAAGDTPVCVKLYSLPEIPRNGRAQEHLGNYYSSVADLFDGRFDGAIITGTEPRQPNLKQEPYWDTLASILDWAERNTASTVLSCLAAHAGVLHSDGIGRRPLPDKQFGVFDFRKASEHALTNRTPDVLRIPHSRWNETPAAELVSCGYTLLTESTDAGADLFIKKKRRSLFVHFQGHPEYGALTLLKEYRRDIRRFLCKERETYPTMPHGYFDAGAAKLLNEFREHALIRQDEKAMATFPEAAVVGTLQKTWHSSANRVYANWLRYVAFNKADKSVFPALNAARADDVLDATHAPKK
jgi:homoserine O-succinyltransferase/O-acetyltransferase